MAVELDPTDASRAECLIRRCFASVVLFCAVSKTGRGDFWKGELQHGMEDPACC